MLYSREALRQKAEEYCQTHGTEITKELGHGTQGMVFLTGRNTAIKVYGIVDGFKRERDVY